MVVAADGFWGSGKERTFVDIQVFNPYAPANRGTSLSSTYRRHENEKKRVYSQRINEVELSSFRRLVFSLTGGMAREASVLFINVWHQCSQKKGTSIIASHLDGLGLHLAFPH